MKLPNWYICDPPPVEDLLEVLIGPIGRYLPSKLGGLHGLARASPEELKEHLTPSKALRLAATFRLIKSLHNHIPSIPIKTPSDVFAHFRDRFLGEDQEHFYSILLNGKHKIIKEVLVSKGSLTAAIVHPREVFAPAIKERAASIIVLHNHPSGDPSPSQEDIEITKRLKQVGELVGIPLLDHVIIGTDFVSMQERNFI